MTNRIFIITFFITFFAYFANGSENTQAEFRGVIELNIENLQKQNDDLSEKIVSLEKESKSVDDFKNVIDRQDKRIEDINTNTTSLSIVIGLWSIVATFLSIAIPLFFAFRWKNEAMYEAKTAAQNEINDLKIELQLYVEKSKEQLQSISNMHDNYLLQKDKFDNKDLKQYEEIDTDKQSIKNALEYSKQKAELYNNYESWMEVGIFAFKFGDYKEALTYWDKALSSTNDPAQINSILFNKAIAWKKLGDVDKFLEIIDEIINKFQDNPHTIVKEQVSKAYGEKGLYFDSISKIPEAKECFQNGISFFPMYLPNYVNLYELVLINGEAFDQNLFDLFNKYAINDPEARLKFKMLEIINESLNSDQSEQIKLLKTQLSEYTFNNWDWKQLNRWSDTIQDVIVKNRVQQTIQQFKDW